MILHRFMSEAEYECLIAGGRLMNATDHAKERGQKTNSVGFCFFSEDPEDAIHWLSGCTYPERCVTLDIPDHLLRETYGTYRDLERDDLMSGPVFGGHLPTMRKKEYCTTSYSLADGVKVLTSTDRYAEYADMRRKLEAIGLI